MYFNLWNFPTEAWQQSILYLKYAEIFDEEYDIIASKSLS